MPACKRSPGPGTHHPDLDTAPAAPADAAVAAAAAAAVRLQPAVHKACQVHDRRPDSRRYCTAFALGTLAIPAVAPAGWSNIAAGVLSAAGRPCGTAVAAPSEDSPRAYVWRGRAVCDVVPARARARAGAEAQTQVAVGLLCSGSAPEPAQPEPLSPPLRRICELVANWLKLPARSDSIVVDRHKYFFKKTPSL